jgi:histidinol-phosphate aminotransferase
MIQNLLRPHIAALKPYSSARDEYTGSEGVFLDANENPIGSVTAAMYNRYPDPYQKAIKQGLASIKGVAESQIFLGNGSDEAIDLLFRAFCEPHQEEVIILPPTYGMYEVSASINAVKVVQVPLTRDFQLDVPAVLQAITPKTKMLFICSPNNPTGNLLRQEDILQVLEAFQGITIIDEAYIDFAPEASWLPRLSEFPRLVVIQTFSKAWGLASLRLGMAFASAELIAILNKIKAPYNINGVSQALLADSLQYERFKDEMVARILLQRQSLATALQALPYVERVFPSDANFLLVKMQQPKAVYDFLLEDKIIVRDRSKVLLCEGCLRISVGTKEENEALVERMKHFVS